MDWAAEIVEIDSVVYTCRGWLTMNLLYYRHAHLYCTYKMRTCPVIPCTAVGYPRLGVQEGQHVRVIQRKVLTLVLGTKLNLRFIPRGWLPVSSVPVSVRRRAADVLTYLPLRRP